jgi:hypothetical protein
VAGLACLTASLVHAGTVKGPGTFVNESGISVSKNVPIPLNSYGIDQLAVQVNYSTAVIPAIVFTDGQESTMTITINSNTAISTAAATDFLTVLSTNLAGACVTYFSGTNSYPVCNGNWRVDVTSDTAYDIAAQFNALFTTIVSTQTGTGSIVYSTATLAGSAANVMRFTSNTSSITVGTANFIGGQDGATLWIGNTQFKFGGNVTIGAAASNTATALATAITASSVTTGVVANAVSAVVYATSTAVGTNTNYATYSSTQAALTLSPYTSSSSVTGAATGAMYGGSNSAYTINTTVIASTATFYWPTGKTPMVALPLLYVQGTNAITGLTTATTYFMIPVTQSSFGLSTTSTGAVAGYAKLPSVSTMTAGVADGTFIMLTSSRSLTTADNYTLSVSSYAEVMTFGWQVSNDCVNYGTYASTGTVTMTPPASGTTTYVYDFGTIDFACLQAVLTKSGPSYGAPLTLSIIANGKNSGL